MGAGNWAVIYLLATPLMHVAAILPFCRALNLIMRNIENGLTGN